jgi:predicted RNase H-like nuclease
MASANESHFTSVAGVDGTRGGWAVVLHDAERSHIQRVRTFSEIFDRSGDINLVAVDVPIGLLDAYAVGGPPL